MILNGAYKVKHRAEHPTMKVPPMSPKLIPRPPRPEHLVMDLETTERQTMERLMNLLTPDTNSSTVNDMSHYDTMTKGYKEQYTLPAPEPGTCILWRDGHVIMTNGERVDFWRDAWDGVYADLAEALNDLAGADLTRPAFMQPADPSTFHGDPRMFVRAAYLRGGDIIDGENLIGIVHSDNDASLEFEHVVVESVDGGYWDDQEGWARGYATDGMVVIYTDNTATPLVVPGDTWCIWVGVDEC